MHNKYNWESITQAFRQFAYDKRAQFDKPLEWMNFLASIAALGFMICLHGLFLNENESDVLSNCIYIAFGLKVFHLFLRPSIEIFKAKFIRLHITQFIIIGIMFTNGIFDLIFQINPVYTILEWIGYQDPDPTFFLAQFYAFIFSISDIYGHISTRFNLKLKPATLFLLSFLILILIGAFLFTLPGMTSKGEGLPIIDAVFTSVSAACVTGLIVVDTATAFSFKGQFVIMLLMQFGGIGIITFASFFTFFLLKSAGIGQKLFMQDIIATENFEDTRHLLRQIILYTLIIEAIGAIFIFGNWDPNSEFIQESSFGEIIFTTIFHSISAFNNAGFSLFSAGLMDNTVQTSPFVQITIIILILFGGLGFPAIRNLFDRRALRDRLINPWRKWELGTRIAVYSTLILVSVGAILFYFLESNNVLKGQSYFDQILTSIFQSVTTRTAGFNTVDIGLLSIPTIMFFLFLMIIGGNSGGTAGGLKTSTFMVVILAARSTIRNKTDIEVGGRSINVLLVERAFTIFFFTFGFIFLGVFALSLTDPDKSLVDLIFEEFSAYATVGLSRGITADMSTGGKIVLIISMFLGRVGAITIAYALASPSSTNAVKYPEANIMVG